jgi:hypothetical protein
MQHRIAYRAVIDQSRRMEYQYSIMEFEFECRYDVRTGSM